MLKNSYIYPLCLSLLASGGCNQKDETNQNKSPNVIIFLADDMGYNDASVYRNLHAPVSNQPPTSVTPNIDGIAEQGMMFTDFYCGAAVCSPSRAVMLTGRNATRVGIYNWIPSNSPMHLRGSETTIAEMLKSKDYKTAHFGKWHLTSENRKDQPRPNDQGYDYSFFAYNNAQPSHENPENYFQNGKALGKLEGYACQLVVDEAIGWLDTIKSSTEPFYMNVWFNEPHTKLAAPDSLTQRHTYHQKYYGAIENMDYAIGKLIKYLEENDLDDNTIVIFSSDNGSQWPASNDPLRGEKCFNFDGGVRVPFVVKWPGKIPKGKVNHTNGSFADILPTLATITEANLPNVTLDGEDISFVLFKDSAYKRENPIFRYRYFHEPICMLRQGKWNLLGYENVIPYAEGYDERELAKFKPGPDDSPWAQWGFQENHMEAIPNIEPEHFELYNLGNDPGQQHNLAEDYPEVVEEMKVRMLQLRREMIEEGGNWFQ